MHDKKFQKCALVLLSFPKKRYTQLLVLWNLRMKRWQGGLICISFVFNGVFFQMVKVGKDQEMVRSERNSHYKHRDGKKQNWYKVLVPREVVSRMSSHFQ